MKIISTITEKDIHPELEAALEVNYVNPREAVRIVIFDQEQNVALGYVDEENGNKRYSMIGGGIDEGESVEGAVLRESLEEAGCEIKNIIEIGIIEERGIGSDTRGRFIQTNYCYTADVDGEKNTPQFTEEDAKDGLKVVWLPCEEAIANLRKQEDSFITRKTLMLLEEAKKVRGR